MIGSRTKPATSKRELPRYPTTAAGARAKHDDIMIQYFSEEIVALHPEQTKTLMAALQETGPDAFRGTDDPDYLKWELIFRERGTESGQSAADRLKTGAAWVRAYIPSGGMKAQWESFAPVPVASLDPWFKEWVTGHYEALERAASTGKVAGVAAPAPGPVGDDWESN